jgi:hypothetical protein
MSKRLQVNKKFNQKVVHLTKHVLIWMWTCFGGQQFCTYSDLQIRHAHLEARPEGVLFWLNMWSSTHLLAASTLHCVRLSCRQRSSQWNIIQVERGTERSLRGTLFPFAFHSYMGENFGIPLALSYFTLLCSGKLMKDPWWERHNR